MTSVKILVAGALVASTMALSMPTPASALGIVIGPRGGVGVRLGRPGWRGGYYRGPYVRRGVVVRRGWRRY